MPPTYENKTTEFYHEEQTIAMQRQVIDLQDSASILVKLSLRTAKGIVEIDPVKFTLDHPDDGSKAHYGLDASEINQEEQAICISMAIDLRDSYSELETQTTTITELEHDKITTIKTSKETVVKEESSVEGLQMMESFVHVECVEYREKGSCSHLNDLVGYLSGRPGASAARAKMDSANLDAYHHKECAQFEKYMMCNHLEKLLFSILDGEIEVIGIQIDKKPASAPASEEDEDLKFEDFVHKNCQEYRKLGACNHMNEIFMYVASSPPESELNRFLDQADLVAYQHSNCALFKEHGKCDHLKEIIMSIRAGEIEIEGIEVDGKPRSVPRTPVVEEPEDDKKKKKFLANKKGEKVTSPKRKDSGVSAEEEKRRKDEAEKRLMEEQARKAAEKIEKKRREAAEKAEREAEEAKRKKAEEKARKKAEAKAREEALEKERLEAEARVRLVAEAKAAKEKAEAARRAAEAAEKKRIEEEARIAAEKAEAEAAEAARLAEIERQKMAQRRRELKEAEEAAMLEADEEAQRLAAEAAAAAEAERIALEEEQERELRAREAEKQAILVAQQQAADELDQRLRSESIERARLEDEELLAQEEEERRIAETERVRDEAEAKARAERQAEEELQFQVEEEMKQEQQETLRRAAEITRQKRIESDNAAMQAKEIAMAAAAERARAQEAQQAEARVEIALNFVDDATAHARGADRDVRDFCPKYCFEFDRYGTCEHVDEIPLSAFKNEQAIRDTIDAVPDTDAACSDEKLKTIVRQLTVEEEPPMVDHCIRIVLKVKKRKIAERVEVESVKMVELNFGDTFKQSGRWDTEVRDFCPEGCREFEKYGTCIHVDRISLDDFKHPGCEEFEDTNTCSHLREAMAAIPDNDEEMPRHVMEVVMSQFKHLDCQDDRDHGHCDHLVRLALRVKKRKATERKIIDEDVKCFLEECMDFKTTHTCTHVESALLDNFKHMHCEEFEQNKKCEHLQKLNKYVMAQNSHKDAIQVISALHLNNYEYNGPKSLEKNPDFTSIARILTRVSAKTPRPRNTKLAKIPCFSMCTEWRLTGICPHIDAELLKHFSFNQSGEFKQEDDSIDALVARVKAYPTHEEALAVISAMNANSVKHSGGLGPREDPKTADIKSILTRISWRWPRPKDHTGSPIACESACVEYGRLGLCGHVDESLTKCYEHLRCKTYQETGKCGHLYHTVEKIKLEPSHRLASKLIARIDLSEYRVKGGVDFNEHRNCNELIKVLRRISQRWDRKFNKEPDMPLTPLCPVHCLEFAKYLTCTHAYDRSLDQFSDSDTVRQCMIQLSELGPEATDDQIRDICDKFSHKDCKEYRETGRCKHLYTIANRIRQRLHINYDPDRAKIAGEFCVYMCDEAKDQTICVHMDGKKLRRFAHANCEEYTKEGACKHLIELMAYCREEKFSTDSITEFKRRNLEFYHVGCIEFRKFGRCDHLDDILLRAIERFDVENRYDEWFHRGCDTYKSGEICEHMRESKLDEFHHKSCDDAKVYGKCYHSYEFVAQWSPDWNGFEYLRRTYPNEFDKFYHDRCNDYTRFGSCHHKAEKQLGCFKREDGADSNLRQLMYDFMLTDLEGEWDIERWLDNEGAELRTFIHERCALAEIYGSCDHMLDMLCEWKYKYTSDLKIVDYNDRKYEAYFHQPCGKYMKDGICIHIDDPKFEKWSHRGCLDYGRFGTCNHMRDGVLMWRAQYRDEYNAESKATKYLRREYRFRKDKELEEDDLLNQRKERKPWEEDEVIIKKNYGVIQDDPNLDKMKNIDLTFKKLMKRTYEIEADYHAGVASRTRGVGQTVRETGHSLQAIRDRVHNLLRKQDNITSKFKDLDDEYYYDMC